MWGKNVNCSLRQGTELIAPHDNRPHFCTRLLRSCNGPRSLSKGKQVHLLLLKSGLDSSLFVSNCLLQMYTRCSGGGGMTDARRLFDEMPSRNCFSWNSLIDAYLKSNHTASALQIFDSMPQKNDYSWNAAVTGLVRCGDIQNARRLFDDMPIKNAVALNAVIHWIVRRGQAREALHLYKKICSCSIGDSRACTDSFVMSTVVSACADLKAREIGKQIHGSIVVGQVELDSVLGSALVNMYAKCEDFDNACRIWDAMAEPDAFSLSALVSGYADCGRLLDARRLFNKGDSSNVVLWNSMINGYVSNDQVEEALGLFKMMRTKGVRVDSSTFASILSGCANFSMLKSGRQMHACAMKLGIVEDIVAASALIDSYSKSGIWDDACLLFAELKVHDTVSLNSMINVYSNCGRIDDARLIFESIPNKSLISWNSMIVGYSQNGRAVEAIDLLSEMHRLDVRLDKVALASALSACACICANGLGEQIFARATVVGLESDQIISTSLVDFYCKCGNVSDGRRLFDGMNKYDEAPWNSMLMGYASNGYGIEVLELFEAMKMARVSPNEVTFIGVLSGCCHCGMVEEGLRWFHSMKPVYGIDPIVEHYSCIADLLVRSGQLEEAIGFIDTMPFKADAIMLTSVLGGCKARGDESLGLKVAKRLFELNPQQSGPYVQLSSMYATHGEWERSAGVRQMMLERSIEKNPGFSWIN